MSDSSELSADLGYVSELFDGIQGEGLFAGYRQAFIRFSGCGLGCDYCDTKHAQEREGMFRVFRGGTVPIREHKNPVEVKTIVGELDDLLATIESITAISITGGEPLEQPRFLRQLLLALKALGHKVHLETNGVESDALALVQDLCDVISMDIKLPSVCGRDDLWDRHAEFLKRAQECSLVIKIPIARLTKPSEIEQAAGMIKEAGRGAPVFLQPIADKNGDITISYRQIIELYEVCRRHVEDVRVIPQIHKVIGSP